MLTILVSILASLISVVNPLGAVPLFISLTKDYTKKKGKLHSYTSVCTL
ncbi:MAG: hypothetical protein IPN72_12695 [Saprospiraceae bacterium]|nr:hypothetical protein [Saprospiraceae bacterium]